jgi:hypothetical protein
MSDFPAQAETTPVGILSFLDTAPEIGSFSTVSGRIWPVASKAIFLPVTIDYPITILSLSFLTGANITANLDLGIYDFAGNRIVSSGSVTQPVASTIQVVDIVDTLLNPGYYFLASVFDNIVSNPTAYGASATSLAHFGVCEMASAFPLPTTATYSRITSSYALAMSAHLRSVV